jgi:hypothetical protein
MDTETARTVALLSGGFALGGALLGVLIAGVLNYAVAWQNREGQLALARDAARRRRRELLVQGTLDFLTTRYPLYLEMAEAAQLHETALCERLLEGAWQTIHPLTQSTWLAADGFPDDHPLLQYIAVERRFLRAAQLASQGQGTWRDANIALGAVHDAIAAIYQAAEWRIDQEPAVPRPWWHRWLAGWRR